MIIPGFSDYDITPDGVVTRVSTNETIKHHIVTCRNSKYARVSLQGTDGVSIAYNVLALLAWTYLGKPPNKGFVMAKDGNNLNTVVDNVAYTTYAIAAAQQWKSGKMNNRRKRARSYDEDSITMVYEALLAYDTPVAMTELSYDLQVSYTTVRYSMVELRKRGKVRKTKEGFEVIR